MENLKSGLEDFLLEKTSNTPEIKFKEGTLSIKGRSAPENTIEFYKDIINYLEEYCKNPAPLTEVNINLEYFNTPSSKCLLNILRKIESIYREKKDVIINWYYEEDDEDMFESGEDFGGIIRVPFKIHPIPVD